MDRKFLFFFLLFLKFILLCYLYVKFVCFDTIAFVAADYQGLTKSFCHGKIFCSSITAKLVNMKLGIPWDSIQVVPLNQKINIAGIDVTCLDANHCPGSIIILFEPPNSKVWFKYFLFRDSSCVLSLIKRKIVLFSFPYLLFG